MTGPIVLTMTQLKVFYSPVSQPLWTIHNCLHWTIYPGTEPRENVIDQSPYIVRF